MISPVVGVLHLPKNAPWLATAHRQLVNLHLSQKFNRTNLPRSAAGGRPASQPACPRGTFPSTLHRLPSSSPGVRAALSFQNPGTDPFYRKPLISASTEHYPPRVFSEFVLCSIYVQKVRLAFHIPCTQPCSKTLPLHRGTSLS